MNNKKSIVAEALESIFVAFWAAVVIVLSVFGWNSEILGTGEFIFCESVVVFTLFYCIYRFNKIGK